MEGTREIRLRVTEDAEGVKTMSSLDMVAYINSTREPGQAVLTHYHFMVKVPTVIDDAPNFRGIYIDGVGREQSCYNFPRREAMLMASVALPPVALGTFHSLTTAITATFCYAGSSRA